MSKVIYTDMPSPIGLLRISATPRGLGGIFMECASHHERFDAEWTRDDSALAPIRDQLDEYFAGTRIAFDLPLDPVGTPFRQQVWRALCDIPYGQTISYGELARRIGNPKAMRAVGLANGANPIAIVIPCHRVIGANGTLTGYGGGLERKQYLLRHEAARSFALTA